MLKSKKNSLRLIEKRFYGYWHALYLSFYSSRFYIDVAKRWRGFGFLYLLFLLSIVVVPISIQSILQFNQYAYADFIEPFTRIPPIKFHHGQAIFTMKMPYYIKNKQDKILIIIDTSGSTKVFNTTLYPNLIALFTDKHCYFREPISPFLLKNQRALPENEIETLSFDTFPDGQFDLANWITHHSGLIMLKNSILISIYPFLISTFFGLIVTMILALTFMGQLTSYVVFRFKLSFKSACRLMIVSSTMSISTFFILKTIGYKTSDMSLFCTLIAYAYFCFAVLAVRRESQKLVNV